MSKSDHSFYGISCTKKTVFRIFFILGSFLIAYLFIYEIDVKSTVSLARNMLTPLANSDRSYITVTTKIITTNDTTPTAVTVSSQKNDKIAQVTTTNFDLTSDSNTTKNTTISQQPKEAFVTFSNNHPTYLALLKVLLDSIHTFSTRPIIAFGIDVDLDIDLKQYPRVIKRRIAQRDCGPAVYFCKLHAIVSSNVEYGVLMETDDVVNYNVDILFEILHLWPYPLPLSPRHPGDPQNYDHFMHEHNVSRSTTPYIHAHVIWTYRALPFLKHVRSLLQQGHFQGANYDETAINVMLWKAGANHTLCKYDPFFTYSDSYEMWPTVKNCTEFCHTAFVTIHGCKEHETSAALFTRLKANVGKPAIQTWGMGGMKHINDTSATCCYPDSKRSPIHPLLCEHS